MEGSVWSSGEDEQYLGIVEPTWEVIGFNPDLVPAVIPVSELISDPENIGSFVQVFGEITVKGILPDGTSNYFILSDGEASVLVYIDLDTEVSLDEVDVGELWSVKSPCMNFNGEIRLSPRMQSDLVPDVPDGPWHDIAAGNYATTQNVTAMAWGDYDNDNDPDVLQVVVTDSGNQIYHTLYNNDGDGGLTPVSVPDLQVEGSGSSASWADFNNDGFLDLYIGHQDAPNLLLLNDGGGDLTKRTLGATDTDWGTYGVAWVDWNVDGLLDLFMTTYDETGTQTNLLLDGALGFTETTPSSVAISGRNQGFVWVDLDGDIDQDLIIASETDSVTIYPNRTGYGFDEPIILDGPIGAQGISAMDWDLDGDQDLLVTYWEHGAKLWLNNGLLDFVEADASVFELSGHGQDAIWGDYDNDGWPDLYVSQHEYYGEGGENQLFHNEDGLRLAAVDEPMVSDTGPSKGAAWVDVNTDGMLDLALSNTNGSNHLWLNSHSNGNNWLKLDLIGAPILGMSPKTPIGAQVTITVGEHVQTQEVRTDTGYTSGTSSVLHFGLGDADVVDQVFIVWPRRIPGGGYRTQTLFNVETDQRLVINEEPCCTVGVEDEIATPIALSLSNYPNPFNPMTTIVYELPAASQVTLRIYDVQGRLVRTLLSGEDMPIGRHEVVWAGKDRAGRTVSTGVYFCRMQAGSKTMVERMTLVK